MRVNSKVRILLADKHVVVRQGIRLLLEAEPGFSVVGEASDGSEAVRLVASLEPDVLVTCPEISGPSGFEVARRVTARSSKTRVVFLSMFRSGDYVSRALRSGVSGYVPKESGTAELVRAIRKAASGTQYLSPLLPEAEIAGRLPKAGSRKPRAEILTDRQREVLHLAAEGLSSAAIGLRLGISSRTVETHRAHVISRLGLRSRTDLIRYALQHGILPMNTVRPGPKRPRGRRRK